MIRLFKHTVCIWRGVTNHFFGTYSRCSSAGLFLVCHKTLAASGRLDAAKCPTVCSLSQALTAPPGHRDCTIYMSALYEATDELILRCIWQQLEGHGKPALKLQSTLTPAFWSIHAHPPAFNYHPPKCSLTFSLVQEIAQRCS